MEVKVVILNLKTGVLLNEMGISYLGIKVYVVKVYVIKVVIDYVIIRVNLKKDFWLVLNMEWILAGNWCLPSKFEE